MLQRIFILAEKGNLVERQVRKAMGLRGGCFMYKWFKKQLKKDQKGFTLVELMVVVVIIGILVGIAIPIYNNVIANAQEAARDANARTLNGTLTMWQTDDPTGNVPTDLANIPAVKAALVPNFMNGDEFDEAVTGLTWTASTGRFTNP